MGGKFLRVDQTNMNASQLSYELAVKQLNLQREDLRNVRSQAAFAAAVAGLIATVFSSMVGARDVSTLLRGETFIGLNLQSILLFLCFGGAVAYAIRVQTNWQQVTFDLNPLFVIEKTERLPAGAGRISDVLFQVLKYDVFGDGTVSG
ncbi:hypothetical protein [Roseovarius sp. A46]|uniref:hypothetical protein n=1 Tax=Roseovarius sp. A46 TaxID=2109331 RepID=UPI0013E97AC2|nr:hypothetical protein [Roseovarius sp. A46]